MKSALIEFAPSDDELDMETGGDGLTYASITAPILPFTQLDNRHFEILAYLILREKAGEHTFYNDVSLLPTGADNGRDVLLRRGKVTGVVQCKRYASKLGLNDLLIEILRFALYAVRDSKLAPMPNTRYEIWTASGLTKGALEFVDSEDSKTIIQSEFPKLIERARGNIVSLKQHTDERMDQTELRKAIEIASNLKLAHVGPEAIVSDLSKYTHIRRLFFRTLDDRPTHASNEEIDILVDKLRVAQLCKLEKTGRYRPDYYVERKSLKATFENFLQDSCRGFVMIGGSGQGKTSWAANLLASPPDGLTTLLIQAEQIQASDRNPIDTIVRLITAQPLKGVSQIEIDQSIWTWLDTGNRLLVVDGLDRVPAAIQLTLSQWVEQALDITDKASVRLVLTARSEAWKSIQSQNSGLNGRFFTRKNISKQFATSHKLENLAPEEANKVYAAYGVAERDHRGAKLNSPSLISTFAKLRAKAPSVVTRLSILETVYLEVKGELRLSGVGPIITTNVLNWIGDQLAISSDGWISQHTDDTLLKALEVLVSNDRLLFQNGLLRLEMDDFAELLLAKRLRLETINRDLGDSRNHPIFMGAVSLFFAIAESNGDARSGLRVLLEGSEINQSDGFITSPEKLYPDQLLTDKFCRIEAIAGSILELESPKLVADCAKKVVTLWTPINLFLSGTKLGEMINEIDLPGRDRFDMVLPLLKGDDTDDWRDKYWSNKMGGRFVTPFTTAIERSVFEAPEAMLSDLFTLSVDPDRSQSAVGSTLLYRAAQYVPEKVLKAAWEARKKHPSAFGIVLLAAPLATAQFLARVELNDFAERNLAVMRMWKIVHLNITKSSNFDDGKIIRMAIDSLLVKVKDLSLRPWLLISRLKLEGSEVLLNELRHQWGDVPDEIYWNALSLLEEGEASKKLILLLEGKEPSRDVMQIIETVQVLSTDVIVDFDILNKSLLKYAAQSLEQSRAVARAIEGMLYRQKSLLLPSLEKTASQLAASQDDQTRLPLIFYAGSPVAEKSVWGEIASRERLLEILVEHETGGNLNQLVWKIIQTANERSDPQRHLNLLAQRFGGESVRAVAQLNLVMYDAKDLNLEFKDIDQH